MGARHPHLLDFRRSTAAEAEPGINSTLRLLQYYVAVACPMPCPQPCSRTGLPGFEAAEQGLPALPRTARVCSSVLTRGPFR